MKFYMNEIQTPIYLNSNYIYDPTAFSLSHYKERSIFQSNVIEFWAPVTDLVIPGVTPGRYFVSSWGNTWNMETQSPFGLSLHTKGYWQMQFGARDANGNYHPITRKLHIVIMKTFCWFPGCDQHIINHMDCNKQNNNLYNLEWCTESENTIHAIQHGKKKVFGQDAPNVYLTDDQVGMIYKMVNKDHMKYYDILKALNLSPYDISESLISNIAHMKSRIGYFKKMGMYDQ